MTVQATWEITIERRDGSKYECPRQFHGRAPVTHEVVETTDEEGRVIRARILGITRHPPKVAGLGIFQISALEID
jgi:hypothetical protein